MLNKNQWKSIWVFTVLLSILISMVLIVNVYNETDDAFISIVYAFIPTVLIIGVTYTVYLNRNNPINVIPIFKKFFRIISKLIVLGAIAFAIGIALNMPLNIGQIIYNKYNSNENIYKSKYAIDRTRSEEWGLKNIEFLRSGISIILEDTVCKLIYEDTINNKSDVPLECVYLRLVACDKSKKDTLYDKVLEIDDRFETLMKKQVSLILPEDFFKIYLLHLKSKDTYPNFILNINELLNRGYSPGQITVRLYKKGYNLEGNQMAIEFYPYGGKISPEYIEKISRSNLKSILENK